MPVKLKKNFRQAREVLQGGSIAVGFPEETTGGQRYPNGATVATVAAVQEFGNPDNRMFGGAAAPIPPRSFLRGGMAEFARQDVPFVRDAVEGAVEGRYGFAQAKLRIAIKAKDRVQREITDGDFAANSPATVALKGSDKPLIDSGKMRQAVDAVVRK